MSEISGTEVPSSRMRGEPGVAGGKPARGSRYGLPLLVLYALVTAVLYSGLLPLWEGFDEPFHFGYVQRLANGKGFPDARHDLLSEEVSASLALAPASQSVKENISDVVSYGEYFSWPAEKRRDMARALRAIPPASRWASSGRPNYEAQQAPLAYALLAWPERRLASEPLPVRVLWLRVLASVTGGLLLVSACTVLCTQLALPSAFRNIAIFCILSSQMTWGTIAHIANDWLALPLALWTLVFLVAYAKRPAASLAVLSAVALAAGLLTKAYCLALVPGLFAVTLARGRFRHAVLQAACVAGLAGPWYVRNVALYGSVPATKGLGIAQLFHEALSLDWPAVVHKTAHSALWTGNNSYRMFSSATLDLVQIILLAAFAFWVFSRHDPADWVLAGYVVLFGLAFCYTSVVAAVATHGRSATAAEWHVQTIVPPLLIAGLAGASRWRRLGRPVAAVLLLLFAYISVVTYVVKLIPFYSGYLERTTAARVAAFYGSRMTEVMSNLQLTALAPPSAILALTACLVALAFIQAALYLREVFRTP